jgi:transcriptional regulator with XRE-family HTH domain
MTKITAKKLGVRIKGLRIQMGLSQSDVAIKLGLSRQAIGQIETGDRAVEGIELAHIADFFSISVDSLLKESDEKKPPRFSGKLDISFSSEKLKNLLLYVLSRCGGKPNVGETVLYKLLYFIDFDSFEMRSESVTGMKYVKLQYGPVPLQSQFMPVVNEMEKKGELKIIKQIYREMAQKKYVALVDPDLDDLPAAELKIANTVIDRLSDMTATQIKAYAHEDVPWIATEPDKVIDYRLVFDRSASYARSDRAGMWQDAAGNDAIKALGKMSEKEFDYYEKL